MPVQLASKTMALYEDAVMRDQGATYRQTLGKVLPHIGDAYRGEENPFRTHLGASVIGSECARAIWYGFHWTTRAHFQGRVLRLFNRGHLEEGRFIALLLTAGIQVFQQDANGKQYRVSAYGGHYGGSGDGVGMGFPDLPDGMPALLEFKTHNSKSFAKLKKEGVFAAKLEHFVQMQTYAGKMGLPVSMYHAINKDDDEIYVEIVPTELAITNEFDNRAHKIIMLREPPAKISKSPGWVTCVWCDHKKVCHLKAPPERNCRTCMHVAAEVDGHWYCNVPCHPDGGEGRRLTKEEQGVGCNQYAVNPKI